MIFSGLEKSGYVLLFRSPDEFYVKFTVSTESIKLTKKVLIDKAPTKNEVCSKAKYIIEYNSDYVLCEILDDLKYDEVFCQVLLCNSNIRLKVDYRRLFYLNIDDIIGDENTISLKINDFSPIFPNYWTSDLISKLKNLLTCEKFIFQFKSTKVDPSDGRYPVDILRFVDRQSVIEEFIDNKLAMRGSDYYKAALENEISQIFYAKKCRGIRYKISSPLVKETPVFRSEAPSSKTLNVEAEPFTPTMKYSPLSTESARHESPMDNVRPLISSSPKSLHIETPIVSSIPVVNPKSEHLTSNIINMLSEMYKDHSYKSNNSSTIPISYQSIFPGAVYFSKQPTAEFQNPRIPLMPNNLNVEIPKSMPMHSPHLERDKVKNPASLSKPFMMNTPNFHTNTASFPTYHRNSLNDSFIFENSTDMVLDVSSIPLPPGRGPTKAFSCHNINANILSSPPVITPPGVSMADSQMIPDSRKLLQQVSSISEDSGIDRPPTTESTPSNCEETVAESIPATDSPQTTPSATDSLMSSFSNLKIEPFSNLNSHMKLVLPDTHSSSPFISDNKPWSPNFSTEKTFPFYANYSSIMIPPTPAYIIRQNNPLDYIHRENIFPFHPNFQTISHQIFSSTNNFMKVIPANEEVAGNSPKHQFAANKIEAAPGELKAVVTSETTIEPSFPSGINVPPGRLIGMQQQLGNYYIQPVNLICFKPQPPT